MGCHAQGEIWASSVRHARCRGRNLPLLCLLATLQTFVTARQSSWSRQVTPERPPLQLPKYGRFSCDHMHLACIWHAMGSHLNRFRPKRERPAHVLHVVRGGPDVKHMWILERIVVTSNQHNPQIAARPCQLQCCTSGLGRC